MCYGFYDWEWVYTCTATDEASGKSADGGGNYASQSGAVNHATENLFNTMDMYDVNTYDCNCVVQVCVSSAYPNNFVNNSLPTAEESH